MINKVLRYAAKSGNIELVKLCVEQGANVNSEQGLGLFHLLDVIYDKRIYMYLAENGAVHSKLYERISWL